MLLVSLDGGQGKGSGRSIPGFHLYQALSSCREHLLAFGGHEGAAGFTITADRVDALREALNDYAAAVMSPDLLRPGLEIDALVSLEDIPCEVVAELESLSPHGHGNPEPLLACCGVAVINCREVGRDGRHLKLLVRENGTVRTALVLISSVIWRIWLRGRQWIWLLCLPWTSGTAMYGCSWKSGICDGPENGKGHPRSRNPALPRTGDG